MPELPEVETVRLGLQRLLPGKVIAAVDFNWPKSFPISPDSVKRFIVGAKITGVNRRAKLVLIKLDSGYTLVIHLKMTGQLVFRGKQNFGAGHPSESLINELPDKSTRVALKLTGGEQLFFNDQRKFGWLRLVPTVELTEKDFFKTLGPEPLSPDFSWQKFRDRLKLRPKSNIKAVLLDQKIIAGIGNIYTDESLWKARIHPNTLVQDLRISQVQKLYAALLAVLNLSIAKGGSTDRNYVNAEGKKGSYLSFANIFRRQGQPCPRCGSIINKIRVAGRGTHVCPHCQRLHR